MSRVRVHDNKRRWVLRLRLCPAVKDLFDVNRVRSVSVGHVGPSKLLSRKDNNYTLVLGRLCFWRQWKGLTEKPKLGIWVRSFFSWWRGSANLDEGWWDTEQSKRLGQGYLKRKDKLESYFRGKGNKLHKWWIRKVREVIYDSEASTRGIIWRVVRLTKTNAQKEQCILEKGREWVQFGASWVWQASQIIQMEMSRSLGTDANWAIYFAFLSSTAKWMGYCLPLLPKDHGED